MPKCDVPSRGHLQDLSLYTYLYHLVTLNLHLIVLEKTSFLHLRSGNVEWFIIIWWQKTRTH